MRNQDEGPESLITTEERAEVREEEEDDERMP